MVNVFQDNASNHSVLTDYKDFDISIRICVIISSG